MAGLTTFRLKWLRTTGAMPSAEKIEARRRSFLQTYERFVDYRESAECKRFEELQAYVTSGEPERIEAECRMATYRGSQEEGLLQEYRQLGRLRAVRRAKRGKGDLSHPDYLRYLELHEKVQSDAFAARVAYLKDRKKYQKSEAGRALAEFKLLQKSRDLRWYHEQVRREVFADHERSEELFYDDFSSPKLDTHRWLLRFFWGEALLGKPYSFMGDPHCYTDGANISVSNGSLVIATRPERAHSLAWDTKLGFMPKSFDFTSGVVTTGQSFRMEYGYFEVKVRFSAEVGVYHAFYLTGDKMLPQVDIFRSDAKGGKSVSSALIRDGEHEALRARVGVLPFAEEFFIFRLERTPDRLVWSINGIPYHEETRNLPHGPLYLVLASGVKPDSEPEGESRMEIAWVRCVGKRYD